MREVYYVLCTAWPVILAGLAICGMSILMFVVSQRFFYFKRRVKTKDYKVKSRSPEKLETEDTIVDEQ